MSQQQGNSKQNDEISELKNIIEAAFFAAQQPIGIRKIQAMFAEEVKPSKEQIDGNIGDYCLSPACDTRRY